MLSRVLCCLLSITCLAAVGANAQQKAADFSRLKRSDLEKLAGVWEMKVDSKKGWTGTLRATITLYAADSEQKDFALIRYDYDLVRDKDKLSIRNAPGGGIALAGVKRGEKLSLVTAVREGFVPDVPFEVKPTEELSAPFTVTGDALKLNVSKGVKHFCFPFADVDLEWGQLQFMKTKKK